jgi:hypothetical protein
MLMERIQARADSRLMAQIGVWLFAAAILSVIGAGWIYREDTYLTAASGFGYALGITGVTLVVLLLLYPLRKRWRLLQRIGSVKFWFRFHMLCGVLAPTAIIFHSNFQLGSINGKVAFWSMMIVASSGVVGRYLYTKIHYGLYGERANLRQLTQDFDASASVLGLSSLPLDLQRSLEEMTEAVRHPPSRFLRSLRLLLWVAPRSHVVEFRIRRLVSSQVHSPHISARDVDLQAAVGQPIGRYFWLIRKISGFTFFERLFSLWHTLHVPLFALLLLTTIVHVVVVHAY